MGLDMYLEKCNRKMWDYRNLDINDVKVNNPTLYEELKPFIIQRGKYIHWESIFTEIGYWRKANAIHRWFVENVQNGEDDCDYYAVSKEQIKELLEICITIKNKSKMQKGFVKNGETYKNGMWCPCYEEGEYIVNPEIASELLPTQDGFFFGGTAYDQWYMENIKSTIDILTKTLEETDFDREMVVYNSSW